MPTFAITAEGDAIERYVVEADTIEEARAKFERGDLPDPWSTEVSGSTITQIEEEE